MCEKKFTKGVATKILWDDFKQMLFSISTNPKTVMAQGDKGLERNIYEMMTRFILDNVTCKEEAVDLLYAWHTSSEVIMAALTGADNTDEAWGLSEEIKDDSSNNTEEIIMDDEDGAAYELPTSEWMAAPEDFSSYADSRKVVILDTSAIVNSKIKFSYDHYYVVPTFCVAELKKLYDEATDSDEREKYKIALCKVAQCCDLINIEKKDLFPVDIAFSSNEPQESTYKFAQYVMWMRNNITVCTHDDWVAQFLKKQGIHVITK